jgi:nucleotide sugar dehydrogenase
MRVAVVGAGYVGAVTAAGLAAAGHDVLIYDADQARSDRLAEGMPPVDEPGLKELIRTAGPRLRSAPSAAEASRGVTVALVCVGTPSDADGAIDLRHVEDAVRDLSAAAGRELAIVIRSTVVPGTVLRLDREILRPRRAVGQRLELGSNPEFLREGRAVADFLDPDRVVIGYRAPWVGDRLAELYAHVEAPLVHMSPSSAELTKYASNALLATLVSLSNELADVAEHVEGADVTAALLALGQDRRWRTAEGQWSPAILSYLWPGCGYGGSCLPKDVKAIVAQARTLGAETPILAAVDRVNDRRADHLADAVVYALNGHDRRVVVLGTAFKAGTTDERESPGLRIAHALRERGANVTTYDPAGASSTTQDLETALTDKDAWVVVTWSPEFDALRDRAQEQHVLFVDARRRFQRLPHRYIGPGIGPPNES